MVCNETSHLLLFVIAPRYGQTPLYDNLAHFAYFIEHFVFLAYQGNDTSTEGGARYLCNHRRAYKFFTDSISPKCHFTSFPCENYDKFQAGECFACGSGSATGKECGRLGYYSNQSKGRGSLFLLTRDEEPFCGKYS